MVGTGTPNGSVYSWTESLYNNTNIFLIVAHSFQFLSFLSVYWRAKDQDGTPKVIKAWDQVTLKVET
jgi:hypothetical protein